MNNSIIVTLFFAFISLTHLNYTHRLKRLFKEKHNFNNSFLTSALLMIAGIIYPLITSSNSLSIITIVIITPLAIIITLLTQKSNNSNPEKSFLDLINNFFLNEKKIRILHWDISRKSMHSIPVIILLLIFIITGPDIEWIITIGYSGIVLFIALDFIRFSFVYKNRGVNHLLPKRIINALTKLMKRRELYEPLKTAPLILGMIPALFLPFNLFMAVALISTISDGAASVMGHAFGRIKSKRNGKTGSGYTGGIIASFTLVMLSSLLIKPLMSFFNALILGLAGALAFFIADFINWGVDDNIINPLITTLAIGVAYILI